MGNSLNTTNINNGVFKASNIDFTIAQIVPFGNLSLDEFVFIPTLATVVFTNVIGTFATAGVVSITDSSQLSIASGSLPQSIIQVDAGLGTGKLSQTQIPILSNGVILGGSPVSNATPSNGAAAVQTLTLDVTTAAVATLASVSRQTTNNISTITVGANITSFSAGSIIDIRNIGNNTYNGSFTVLNVNGATFSFYNPNLVTEASTADTNGRIGSITGDVYVYGYIA